MGATVRHGVGEETRLPMPSGPFGFATTGMGIEQSGLAEYASLTGASNPAPVLENWVPGS